MRKIHTGVSNLDVARLADDDLFGDWALRLVAALRPGYVLYKMTPPHSASYKSHSYVTQELMKMKYLVSAYDRFPCDLTGARTSRFRWINVGVRQSDDDAVLPPGDCTAGLFDDPFRLTTVFFHLSNALAGPLEPGVPSMLLLLRLVDEFYTTRAVLAGVFVGDDGEPNRSLDKGRKLYSLGGPTFTLASSDNFHFIDNRSADPNLVGVRQLEFVEILEISGFTSDLSATACLNPTALLTNWRTVYSIGGPTFTLTSSNNFHFIGNRSAGPNLVGVRQLELAEILEISGFTSDFSATACLHSRTEEDALKDVAAAVPPPTWFHLYRVIINHASAAYLSLRACSGLEEAYGIDLLPEHDLPCVDDDEFAMLAADVVTQAAHCPASSSEGALPSTLRLGTTITEGLHGSPLGSASSLSLSNNDAAHLTGDDQDGDSSIDGAVDTAASSHAATRQADVRVRPQSCPVSTGSWPPLHAHGSRAWRRKGALVWRYHSIWHHSKEHMEQHLAAAGAVTYGLEHGDSR